MKQHFMRRAAGQRTEHLTALDECVFICCGTEEVIHHLCVVGGTEILHSILRSSLQELRSFFHIKTTKTQTKTDQKSYQDQDHLFTFLFNRSVCKDFSLFFSLLLIINPLSPPFSEHNKDFVSDICRCVVT